MRNNTIKICTEEKYSFSISKSKLIGALLKLDVSLNRCEPFIMNKVCYNSLIDYLLREMHNISLILIKEDCIYVSINHSLFLSYVPEVDAIAFREINILFKKLYKNYMPSA